MNRQLSLFEKEVLLATSLSPKTSDTYLHVQKALCVSDEDAERTVQAGSYGRVKEWKRKVRWIQQTLKHNGYIARGEKGWTITGKGERTLTKRTKGAEVVFYTKYGVAIWGDAAMASGLFEGEIDLIMTSPEYFLAKQKEYSSNKTQRQYLDKMTSLFEGFIPMLTPSGSIVVNLGDRFTNSGSVLSLYKERLLIELKDKLGLSVLESFFWWSPSKLPQPINSVCKRRTHVVPAVESIYWLSLDPLNTKSDNRNVLVEYAESTKLIMEKAKRKPSVPLKTVKRPSGNEINEDAMYQDRGGAIGHNILCSYPEPPHTPYTKYCRENALPIHPARFPNLIVEFFIKFLTNEGDTVCDPFGGSLRVGEAAEKLQRHWVGIDRIHEYLLGAMGRFEANTLKPCLVRKKW